MSLLNRELERAEEEEGLYLVQYLIQNQTPEILGQCFSVTFYYTP
jgi:hypothetical protein